MLLILYFIINSFFAGAYCMDPFNDDSLTIRIIRVVFLIFLFIPFKIIDVINYIGKILYLKFMDFTLVNVYIYYKKGKYKDLDELKIERIKTEISNAKYHFQKKILQNILNDNQKL